MIDLDGGDLGKEPGFESFVKPTSDGAVGTYRFVSSDYRELKCAVAQLKLAAGVKFIRLADEEVFALYGLSGGLSGRYVAYMYVYHSRPPDEPQLQLPGIIDRE
jgi:hypothetical protein